MRHQLVVHEPGTIHRFHDSANWLPTDGHPTGKPVQAVAIRGCGEAVDQLPLIGDQADIDSFATQIQTNMQHDYFLLLSPAQRQAGSILPTTYRDLVVGPLSRTARPARIAAARGLTYAVRYRGPTFLPGVGSADRGAGLHRIPLEKRRRRPAGRRSAGARCTRRTIRPAPPIRFSWPARLSPSQESRDVA